MDNIVFRKGLHKGITFVIDSVVESGDQWIATATILFEEEKVVKDAIADTEKDAIEAAENMATGEIDKRLHQQS